jgi:hypothetical protein
MFKSGGKRSMLVIVIVLLTSLLAYGQSSTSELKERGKEAFEKGNYSEAYDIYTQLLEKYPKDGNFNYYAGLALYRSNKNMEKAIEHLKSASLQKTVPSDVYFHLGQAYERNYQFAEAKSAFQKFKKEASRSELRSNDPEIKISSIANAQQLTMDYNPFEILASSLFTFADSNYYKQVSGKGGVLSKKPEELMGRDEDPSDLTSLMFLPRKSQKGMDLYFSGYSGGRKKDADLFSVRKNLRNNFGDEDELKSLNTDQDEIFPYFDPVSNDLYFASRGHNSMGGFDVFKSHYDQERKEWSEPVNLGFPLNSPENEYFAMPGPDLGTFLLITDRQGLDSMLTVYKLVLQEPKRSLASADHEELKKIGKLGGISAIPNIVELEEESEDMHFTPTHPEYSPNSASDAKQLNADELNIARALEYQKKSDSLSMLAKETRVKVRKMPNPNDRWAWQRQIIEWEKKARDYSEKAAASFAMLEERKKQEELRRNKIPGTIQKEKEISGISVYTYTSAEDRGSKAFAETNHAESKPTGPGKQIDNQNFETKDEPGEVIKSAEENKDLSRFLILDQSAYNSNNPFPVNIEIPGGAFYRIQLGVFSETVAYDDFGGISPVTAETIPGKEMTRYYAGKFSDYEAAREALGKVKEYGFTDAFLVSWYDGEKVSINKVIELEKRDREK